ncbi:MULTISPECIES: ectoine hydroxylase [Auritidibacter]|uniref:Ectoine hydroxylase n=2 Tax=Auritidibacter ignavus TaxID=678932 RepID=A0AAJ6DCB3_9MICC|nr:MULTISPECIES: ectoine hydroxylase [Auritidibacter]AXR74559.1 ectoine hydroxylase [Auritidibacter sp. NML130574]NIH72481.1 ectoine hydroxylase [Auritidibacter ignavus]PXA80610.1 ectoine hydroxylase [Auritidibacter sp. NML120636]RMX23101.1 ectoine hydroxylase [Auritidibacter ignavus]WGH81092.1 ectoine hydroxylase [Auritidibacter ignavus]
MTTIDKADTTTDFYPTRTGEEPRVIPRPDRVVQGTAEQGPLDEQTLQSFDEKGYLTIDQLITPEELQQFKDELKRLAEDPEVKQDERTVVEAKSNEVRSIFDIHRSNEVFKKIANDPRLVDRARQILGSDVYIHQSRINYKPGFVGKDFTWHSDFETWHAEDGMPGPRAVSISISLTDNYSFNGPLMIMPGSHQHYIVCQGQTPDDNYKQSLVMQGAGVPDPQILTDFADRFGIDVLEGPAGGAIMFDSNCMHASNGNVTPYSRSNVFIVYNSVENTPVDPPYAAPHLRPDFLGSRDFTPAGSQA